MNVVSRCRHAAAAQNPGYCSWSAQTQSGASGVHGASSHYFHPRTQACNPNPPACLHEHPRICLLCALAMGERGAAARSAFEARCCGRCAGVSHVLGLLTVTASTPQLHSACEVLCASREPRMRHNCGVLLTGSRQSDCTAGADARKTRYARTRCSAPPGVCDKPPWNRRRHRPGCYSSGHCGMRRRKKKRIGHHARPRRASDDVNYQTTFFPL